jgi:hypothetical protein
MSYQDTYVYVKINYRLTANPQTPGSKEAILYFSADGNVAYYTNAGAIGTFANVNGGEDTNDDYNQVEYTTMTNNGLTALSTELSSDTNLVPNNNTFLNITLLQIITSTTVVKANDATGTTHFQNVNFAGVDFTDCLFNAGTSAANIAAVKTNFTNCSFVGATLPCEVKYSTFDRCNMAGAILRGATLIGVDLTKSTGLPLLARAVADVADANNVRTISLTDGGGVNLMLPAFCGITVNTGANPDTLAITLAGTAVEVDAGLASGGLTAVASPSASIPSGPIIINTSSTIITNANVNNNIGRLIPLNVLKLARAVNCVIDIQ